MSICKAVLTGKVVRDPEKRFTPSNVAVTTFTINVTTLKSEGPNLVRVITWKNLADSSAEKVKKDQMIIVDGRLQINSYKDSNGVDRKGLEIDANDFEILSSTDAVKAQPQNDLMEDIPPPSADDYTMDSGDLIDEEEIPF